MALMPEGTSPREGIYTRFAIAQDGKPSVEQLELQAELRDKTAEVAAQLNWGAADSREKSLALTHFEEALMWAGKAIFS